MWLLFVCSFLLYALLCESQLVAQNFDWIWIFWYEIPGHWRLQTCAPSAYLAWGFLANEMNQIEISESKNIENNREPELLHTHVMALSSIHGARTFPRQGRAQYVCSRMLKVFYRKVGLFLDALDTWKYRDLSFSGFEQCWATSEAWSWECKSLWVWRIEYDDESMSFEFDRNCICDLQLQTGQTGFKFQGYGIIYSQIIFSFIQVMQGCRWMSMNERVYS